MTITLTPEEALYAAYLRQALADFLAGPNHPHYKTAAACLERAHLLTASGSLDTRGYHMPVRRAYRRKEERT